MKFNRLATCGVSEADVLGVEKVAFQWKALLTVAIDSVANDGVVDKGHVDTDLVSPAGFGFDLHQAVMLQDL